MNNDHDSLRNHLLSLLRGGNAHITFDDFVKDFPAELCGVKVKGLPYTAWQVLEHMRIAQWDILEFCRNPKHVSPEWPDGYWPEPKEKGDAKSWRDTIKGFRKDSKDVEALVTN